MYLALVDYKAKKGLCAPKNILYEQGTVLDEFTVNPEDFIGRPTAEFLVYQVMYNSVQQKEYLNIYVSNLIDERPSSLSPARQRNGTFEDPFAHLEDALKRAKDVVAPFFDNVQVTIHMFAGDHFLIENRFDALNIYTPQDVFDDFSLN